jgi:hypothetical protein
MLASIYFNKLYLVKEVQATWWLFQGLGEKHLLELAPKAHLHSKISPYVKAIPVQP